MCNILIVILESNLSIPFSKVIWKYPNRFELLKVKCFSESHPKVIDI